MNLYQRINAIMQEVKTLQKDGKISFGSTRYTYLSEAKTTEIFHELFAKHGLALVPIGCSSKTTRFADAVGDKTKIEYLTESEFTYRCVNIENPEEYVDVQTSGQGLDTGDKGGGKASSYAYKYLIWRMFAIPSNDDPDQVSSDELRAQIDGSAPNSAPKSNNYTPPPDQPMNYRDALKESASNICSKCSAPITNAEAVYSAKHYGRKLCREHQKEAR